MPSTMASTITETSTGRRPNPSARSVAISSVRDDTAEYMALMAPRMAPRPISNAMTPPAMETNMDNNSVCACKYSSWRCTVTFNCGFVVTESLKA